MDGCGGLRLGRWHPHLPVSTLLGFVPTLCVLLALGGARAQQPSSDAPDASVDAMHLGLEAGHPALVEIDAADPDEPGLWVAVADLQGELGGSAFSMEVTDEQGRNSTIPLADDGEEPDRTSGDGVYTGRLELPSNSLSSFRLLDASGSELWSDSPMSGAAVAWTHVALAIENGRMIPEFRSPGGPNGAGGSSASGGPGGGAGRPTLGGQGTQTPSPGFALRGWLGLAAALLLSALAGALGAWIVRRRVRTAPSSRPLAGEGGSGGFALPAGPAYLTVEDDELRPRLLSALARALAPRGPVLLAPAPSRREVLASSLAGHQGVLWIEHERPAPYDLGRWSHDASSRGRPVILVDSVGALEAPAKNEDPQVLLDELLESVSEDGALVVLTRPGEPGYAPEGPILEPDEDGVRVQGGPLILQERDGELLPTPEAGGAWYE